MTTYRTPWRFNTRTIAPGSSSGTDSVARRSCPLAFAVTFELLGCQQFFSGGKGWDVGVGCRESHAHLETSGGEDAAQGVDRG